VKKFDSGQEVNKNYFPLMKKLKVLTVVGTRPEIIRLSRVMARLDESPAIKHITVHTGQNYDYELNQIFYEDLELRKPDYFLNAAGKNASETIGQLISAIDPILESENPDAFLVLGDTNSCLAAIPAKKRHIPVFHMEAGNRCFDFRVPEETNRKIVDHLADVNMPYSAIAREFLLKEGLPADRIIKTGSPMFEVINHYMPKINKSEILRTLNLKTDNYFVVSAHREENINSEKNFNNLVLILELINKTYNMPVIVSTHPRTRKMIEAKGIKFNGNIQLLKPLSLSDFVALEINAKALLSDSGTIAEETSILNLASVNIRETHERPEAMEEGSVMMTGLSPERVIQALELLKDHKRGERRFSQVHEYTVPNVSDKVVRIILSYTDYVRRVVWSEG
jgi:UDP-N-acetyl-L-fucosamine synthase